ncbi:MAG TPA: metalloregulator ArsR/SmtB family transcription factor [Candidatus Eisenbacteria bacterium]|nr:metalloregulator ArsR/SmtB family transcription factor [Candidatus Eisenbacteria bacterium]
MKRRTARGSPAASRKRRAARSSGGVPPDLDAVWKALADPTRRTILDHLRLGPRTTSEIVNQVPGLTRFGVMKHLSILREAGLVQTREEGRTVHNSLNVIPIRLIYERWVSGYQDLWARHLTGLKHAIEEEHPGDV